MAKLVWGVVCERVLIDQQTNLVTYVNALDAVAIPQFPMKAPLLFIGTVWQRGNEQKLEMRVTVYAPNGDPLMTVEANPLEFAPTHKRGRMNVGVAGFEIAGPGRFLIGIETRDGAKWVEACRIPFDVETATAAPLGRIPVLTSGRA